MIELISTTPLLVFSVFIHLSLLNASALEMIVQNKKFSMFRLGDPTMAAQMAETKHIGC